jgi:hypothetical protein
MLQLLLAQPGRTELSSPPRARLSEADAALRPCLLVNPRSTRAMSLGYAEKGAQLATAAGVEVHAVVDPPSLRAVLARLHARRQQQIWMLTGDGTIQLLTEYLAETAQDGWSPALLLLAGGRANLVPRECGGYPAMPTLERALAALREGRALPEEQLPALQVAQAGKAVRYGFMFAGAMVHEAVRLCVENRHAGTGWRHQGIFSDPWVLTKLVTRMLIGRSPLPPPPQVTARLAGHGELAAPMRLLLASTLELRRAPYNPFAARGTGPLRFTAVAASVPRFWWRLPAITRGRFDHDMDLAHGFLSGRGERAELHGLRGYALDGEVHAADPATPLMLSAGMTLRVLRA